MPDFVALIVVVPAPTAFARPLLLNPLLTDAMFFFEEFHLTDLVISCVTPPEYDAVAVNCWLDPTEILGLTGVTTIAASVALITVRVVLPVMPPNLAVMVAEPTPTPVASPLEFDALLMTATVAADEIQVAAVITTCTEISKNIPVSTNN